MGGSWSERSHVGNLLLGVKAFPDSPQDGPLRASRLVHGERIVIVNTPLPQVSGVSFRKLSESVRSCVELLAPGPHVFLLVLQPEDFTKESRSQLQRVLEEISERSFDHCLVLVSPPRENSAGGTESCSSPDLQSMIKKCKYRHLNLKDIEQEELLTRMGQIAKENGQQHVSCEVFEDAPCSSSSNPPVLKPVNVAKARAEGKRWTISVIMN